jgi:hypothetical protein
MRSVTFDAIFIDPHINGLEPLQVDAVEYHVAVVNNRTMATKVAEGLAAAQYDLQVEGTTFYVWARCRNKAGDSYSEWYPLSSTGGLQVTVGFAAGNGAVNARIVPSIAGGALTVTLKALSGDDPSPENPIYISFREADGSYSTISLTATISLTVPSGATLGQGSVGISDRFRLWVIAFNDSGTVRLGIVNTHAAAILDETKPARAPLALDVDADSARMIFSTAIISVAKYFRIIGFMDWSSGLGTPGTWNVLPDITTLYGIGSLRPGDVVQSSISNIATAVDTTTQLVPLDDTVPQVSEFYSLSGTEFTTQAQPVNYIEADVSLLVSHSVASVVVASVLDIEANLVRGLGWGQIFAANAVEHLHAKALFQAGDQTGNSVFPGVAAVTAGTLTINGIGGTRRFGAPGNGFISNYLQIREIMC